MRREPQSPRLSRLKSHGADMARSTPEARHQWPPKAEQLELSVLSNAKHEAVAQALIADPQKVGWRAYKAVYPKSSRHAAETAFGRLLKDATFAARIAALKA